MMIVQSKQYLIALIATPVLQGDFGYVEGRRMETYEVINFDNLREKSKARKNKNENYQHYYLAGLRGIDDDAIIITNKDDEKTAFDCKDNREEFIKLEAQISINIKRLVEYVETTRALDLTTQDYNGQY